MTIEHMRFGYWVTNSTDTHSEYVIVIAFPQQIGNANAPQYYAYMYITTFVYFAVFQKIFEICHIFRAFSR